MADDKEKAQSNVLKTNLIFGSAQVVQMLTTILRAKLIAVILSSVGMGLNAIFQSVLLTVNNVASCGIMQSGIREMARAGSAADGEKTAGVLGVFRKLFQLAGLVGMGLCVLLALPLSHVSFGNSAYALSFAFLGVGVLFYIYMHGEMAVLQGTRRVVPLARAAIGGAVLSLLAGVPCYYFLKERGVVPAIVAGYFVYWLFYRYEVSRQAYPLRRIGMKKALTLGAPIIKLGFVLMIGTFLVSLFTYLTNISIRAIGSLDDVGLYQGAAAIITQSILVVTAVLASDFFPRLSALTERPEEHHRLVNEQLEIVVLVVTPISALVISCSQWIVRLLLSAEFAVIAPMLEAMAFALLFRGLWITMSYVILAHGDRRAYLLYDGLLGNGLNFALNVLAYRFWGLDGIGLSFIAASVAIALLLSAVAARRYGFRLSGRVAGLLLLSVVVSGATYAASCAGAVWGILACALAVAGAVVLMDRKFDLLKILHIRH